jgi:hypothetical protein
MYGDSFKDSMSQLAKTALQEVISSLIRMTIQMAIFRALAGGLTAGFGSAGANSITGTPGAGFGPGLATGGYTGNLPRDKAVNYVHGQEFVVNANATARNRALLESINAGKSVTADMVNTRESAKVNVNIQNYGTDKAFEVQQLSAEEIRIIARDEVRTQTPKIVSQQISRPNSEIATSLARHTKTEWNRNG